jgi:hypothetical protein
VACFTCSIATAPGRRREPEGKTMFVITYSFINLDGVRQMNSTVADRGEVSTILDMIENKDAMSYRIHGIEAA